MSARRLPRQMGTWICCDGTAEPEKKSNCSKRRFTANIVFEHNRDFAAKEGWGRGLRLGRKRRDQCPQCLAIERKAFEEHAAAWEAEKARRDELKKAKSSGAPLPKRSRKKKAVASTPASSPSADSAPALAT